MTGLTQGGREALGKSQAPLSPAGLIPDTLVGKLSLALQLDESQVREASQ